MLYEVITIETTVTQTTVCGSHLYIQRVVIHKQCIECHKKRVAGNTKHREVEFGQQSVSKCIERIGIGCKQSRHPVTGFRRITSYNVCYTKLLRISGIVPLRISLSKHESTQDISLLYVSVISSIQ